MKEEMIMEFLSNSGVEIKITKWNKKYYILVTDTSKKIKDRKVDLKTFKSSKKKNFTISNGECCGIIQ